MIAGNRPAVFIYRGQLAIERSRIEFLLDVAIKAFGSIDVIHLFPGRSAPTDMWNPFTSSRPGIRSVRIFDARISRAAALRLALRRERIHERKTVAVGFSVAAFLPKRRCDVWCINGIPEERLLTSDSALSRAFVRLSWAAARRVRAPLLITVSQPMSDLMKRRLRPETVISVPNTVDAATFDHFQGAERRYVTYLGGASPWQGLDRLNRVWGAMFDLDRSTRFRVISQDPRATILGKHVPASAIEFVSTDDASTIAEWMSEASLAFLYREPNLVNQVSWPMKFGEYLAAGVPCVASRVGWDLEGLIQQFGVGVVVDWHDDPRTTAQAALDYLVNVSTAEPPNFAEATAYLSHESWLDDTARTVREGTIK